MICGQNDEEEKLWAYLLPWLHNGILLSCLKNPKYVTIDVSRGFYAKWNKSDREKNTTWSHLYVESKKQNKQNKTK